MLKKFFIGIAMVMSIIISVQTFAVRIINHNSQMINFQIYDSTCAIAKYTEGTIGAGGDLSWTHSLLFHPDSVCVHASGATSTVGVYKTVKNDNCVVEIENAGFMKGIKANTKPGC
jgi:hypothetical protein